MIINKLKLTNYRNYDNLDINLNEKLNIIIGKNAQGKTNILESIYVLALTKSYMSVNDKNLVKFGCNYSIIEGEVKYHDYLKKFKIKISDTGKHVLINDKDIKKMSDYISNLKVIIFSSENIHMLKEGPGVRRKFLNMEISQLSLKYVKILMDYNNIIKQKNEYLKLNNINMDYLSILNNKIAQLSVEIFLFRKDFIESINKILSDIFFEIMGIDGLKIKYISNIDFYDNKEIMIDKCIEKLNRYNEKESLYKISLIGPHRDDFIFVLNDKNVSLHCSQGQLRSIVLSLKLAEVQLFNNKTGESPILLLDDIFSELDSEKKNNLIRYIKDNVQTIITTTDINMIDEKLVKKASVFIINNGKIFPGK